MPKIKEHVCTTLSGATRGQHLVLLQFGVARGKPIQVVFPKSAIPQLRAILDEAERDLASAGAH